MCLLKLVNKENVLDHTFVPDELIQDPISKVWLCESALRAYLKLNAQITKDGLMPLVLVSGYRDYDYQKKLYDRKTSWFISRGLNDSNARAQAAKVVAPPGSSEHQLGLAIDVASYDMKDLSDPLTEAFGCTPEAFWLSCNAHKYGFIKRYPKDKTEITQITYEPWHYRYVGTEHASNIHAYAMCLEEYIDHILG